MKTVIQRFWILLGFTTLFMVITLANGMVQQATGSEEDDPFIAIWSFLWQGAKDKYTGNIDITKKSGDNTYIGKLTLIQSNGNTVTQDAIITVSGDEVRIECSNPSQKDWSPDRFYVVRTGKRMQGYSLDLAGNRGKNIEFTRP